MIFFISFSTGSDIIFRATKFCLLRYLTSVHFEAQIIGSQVMLPERHHNALSHWVNAINKKILQQND